MRHKELIALACGAALGLSSCAGQHARYTQQRFDLARATADRLASAPVCCTAFREMRFAVLEKGVKQEIQLTHESPVFAFQQGRSRFAAFKLPPLKVGGDMDVFAVEERSGHSKTTFRPMLVLLNSDFEPLPDQPELYFDDSFMGWDFEGHIAHVGITEDVASARYAVVAADPSVFGEAYYEGAQTDTFMVSGVIVPVSRAGFLSPYSYEGIGFIKVTDRE